MSASVAHPRILLLAALLTLQACIFVPRTTEHFDGDCQIVSRRMALEPVQIASIAHCNGDECVILLAAAGATAAASLVISGSIAVVGNMVYWLEERSSCIRPARQ
ncbi:MAG: hypothetical protein RLY71_4298 [Pseudomonadota bacterium]|jgi:hypothetical protein